MEAQKLKKKKNGISKGKIKKTIKNVICRPDPIFWPVVTETEERMLQTALEKHRVHIPEFKKPHWNAVKSLPKEERPKCPQIQKVKGLLFGISTCCDAVKTQNCTGVLIDANINPQAIVQPIIDACTASNLSVLCLKTLKQLSLTYFGIKTSCLAVQKDYLQELSDEINKIYKNYTKPETKQIPMIGLQNESLIHEIKKENLQMDVDACCPYVYRTDKKTRAFVPNNTCEDIKLSSQFTGQQFIKLPQEDRSESKSKAYMRMILKKVTNNPNRVKAKHKL